MAQPDLNYDVALRGIDAVVTENCSGYIQPTLEIKACGQQDVTSMEIETRDNGGQLLNTYNWTGNAKQNETIFVDMDEFNIGDAANLQFDIIKVNGNDDEAAFDNYATKAMGTAKDMDGTIYFQIKTPADPAEMIIDVEDMQTGQVIEHYTFDQGSHAYKFYAYLPSAGCYRLMVKNPNGTGCGTGFGQIKDNSGQSILVFSRTNNVYTYRLGVEMNATTAAVSENEIVNTTVYPNPASNVINIDAEDICKVEIYNAAGQLVYSNSGMTDNLKIETNSFENGIYVVNITNVDGQISSQRIVVKK